MKKFKLFAAALGCLVLSPLTSSATDRPIPANQLPQAAKTLIAQAFPGQTIAYAEKDADHMKTTYEVRLGNGTQVDFNGQGVWDKVETYGKAVPASFIPPAIAQYVKSHYNGQVITKIDKERHGFDVKLSNGMELKFSRSGAFLGIDD